MTAAANAMGGLSTIFAGLGLFFIGVKLIGDGLQQLSSRRFRQAVAETTRWRVTAALLGMVSGALTQSTSAVTFVVVGMTTARLTDIHRAIPMVIWANVGTAALVLLATLRLHEAALMLTGAVGLAYFANLHKAPTWRQAVVALLGFCLLFLGLQLIKDGATPLRDVEIVREFVTFAASNYFIAFLIGMLLTLVAQSSATVSVIAVSLISVGLLEMNQTIMLIYGAGVGSGLSVWFMAAGLSGLGKQLVNLQLANKLVGAAVLVPLFLMEVWGGVPLVRAVVSAISASEAGQAALIYLAYQVVAAVVVTIFQRPLFALIQHYAPETSEETLSRPRFIGMDAPAGDPETALLLVAQEQHRLVGYLVHSLDNIRHEAAGHDFPDYQTLYRAGQTVNGEIHSYLAGLMENVSNPERLGPAILAQNRTRLTAELQTTVREMVHAINEADITPRLANLTHSIVEGLHAALLTLADELKAPQVEGNRLLRAMTADRSALMDQVRRNFLKCDAVLDKTEQSVLYDVTSLFERAVWLINRMAALLDEDDAITAAAE